MEFIIRLRFEKILTILQKIALLLKFHVFLFVILHNHADRRPLTDRRGPQIKHNILWDSIY